LDGKHGEDHAWWITLYITVYACGINHFPVGIPVWRAAGTTRANRRRVKQTTRRRLFVYLFFKKIQLLFSTKFDFIVNVKPQMRWSGLTWWSVQQRMSWCRRRDFFPVTFRPHARESILKANVNRYAYII